MRDFKINIYCCVCEGLVEATLVTGEVVYPHRHDLCNLPFWMCPECFNFVGCHHKTKNRTKPLGVIPSPEIKRARKEIHKILDPLWKKGIIPRKELYSKISDQVGWTYHTAELRNLEEARKVYRIIKNISQRNFKGE